MWGTRAPGRCPRLPSGFVFSANTEASLSLKEWQDQLLQVSSPLPTRLREKAWHTGPGLREPKHIRALPTHIPPSLGLGDFQDSTTTTICSGNPVPRGRLDHPFVPEEKHVCMRALPCPALPPSFPNADRQFEQGQDCQTHLAVSTLETHVSPCSSSGRPWPPFRTCPGPPSWSWKCAGS